MASRNIKGITIEIDGNTSPLQSALKDVNGVLKQTQADLKDVNKLLKLDPTNVDLLKQKQGLLKDAIKATSDKLDMEKKAYEQLKNADPSEENTRKMQVLERQIADDELALKSLTKQSKEFGSVFKQELEAVGDKLKDVGGQVTKVGEDMTKNLTVPIMAGGAAAVAAFTDVDSAMDEMIKKTGASGEALEEMEGIVESIATSIPTDLGTAAAAVGEVSTRFELTGDALEDLSTKFVKFAELNNTDVVGAVDTTQQAMAAWGLSADDTGAFLDTLTKAAQDSGSSAMNLADVVADNKTVFDEMGFSVSDAVNWLANLEKNGIDSSTAMAGLKKGLANASKDGISMKAALYKMNIALQNAGSSTEAMSDVMELFGNKAGPALVSALQEGRLSFEALGTSMDDSLGTVDETFDATLDPIDNFKTIMNQLKLTGAEVGGTLMEMIAPALQAVAEAIGRVKEWWDQLSPGAQQAIITVLGIVAAIGPLISIIGGVITAIGTVSTVLAALTGPIGIVIAIIAALVAAGVALYKNWDKVCEWAGKVKDTVVGAWNAMTSFVTEKMNAMKDMISGKWDAIKAKYEEAGGGIKGIVSAAIEGVKQYFTLGFDAINALTGGKLNAIKDKFTSILNSAKEIVRGAIDKIKSFFNFSWSLPKLKMPHFSISGSFSLSPPSVPKLSVSWYKKAYQDPVLFTQPTVIPTVSGFKGFGDGAGAEVVMGLNRLKDMVDSGRTVTNNFTIVTQPNQNAQQIAMEVSNILYSQYQATGY